MVEEEECVGQAACCLGKCVLEGPASVGDVFGLGGIWWVPESGLLSRAFNQGRRHQWDGLQEGGLSLLACGDPVFALHAYV